MKEARQAILQGMDDPKQAATDIAFVCVLLSLILGFCSWYAVPIPPPTNLIPEPPEAKQ